MTDKNEIGNTPEKILQKNKVTNSRKEDEKN
jgi:hypothetical protein